MSTIHSLLNPAPESGKTGDSELELSLGPKHYPSNYSSSQQARKKQKICKDAAVFVRGSIRGECRYPPCEYQDKLLAAQHQQFEVHPMGEIADYPRHIPYNSGKKFFFEKTGRESLEVFQYNFRVPGDDTQYAMLWDYNIGLVRTTPLFKCTGHSKTTPAKMLNRNPGLRDICHSITGGALVAQGYWIPHEAAKAVAATFCWHIRYALTPVFGVDFPAMCIHPDADDFGDMTIDPAITKRCTEQAKMYCQLEIYTMSRQSSATPTLTPLTPDTPTYPRNMKPLQNLALKAVTTTYSSDAESTGSYTSPSMTPEPSYRGLWTPANTPRSVPQLSTPRRVSTRIRPAINDPCRKVSSPELSPKTRRVPNVEEAYDGDSSEDSAIEDNGRTARQGSSGLPSDEKAAFLLMSLRLQHCCQQQLRGKKRRAST